MTNDFIYIDLDGVILDSEERMLERKFMAGFIDHKNKDDYYRYFEYTQLHPEEWDSIIRDANSINDSVEIIRELEKMKKNLAILTKIHTLNEMKVKIEDLREHRKINSPVFFAPPGVKKHQIVIPNKQILVDDSSKNVEGWIEHGGTGFIFDKNISENTKQKVKSLEFLLKE